MAAAITGPAGTSAPTVSANNAPGQAVGGGPVHISTGTPGMGGVNTDPTTGNVTGVASAPTVLSDSNIRESVIPQNQSRLANYNAPGPSTTTSTNPNGTSPSSTIASPGSIDYSSLLGGTSHPVYDPTQDPIYQQELGLLASQKSGNDAVTAASIDSIHNSYADLLRQQQTKNSFTDNMMQNSLMNDGSARYAQQSSTGILSAQNTADLQSLSDLTDKENAAVAAANQANQNNNAQLLDKQLTIIDGIRKDKQALAQKVADDLAATKKQNATDVASIAEEAAKNGATPDVLKAINASTDKNSAITASGNYLQTATGQLGDYLQYKRDALTKGLTPTDYATWKAADDAKTAKAKASEAYSTAYGSARGKAAGEAAAGLNPDGTPVVPIKPDPHATGITAAAGLSLIQYNYLTQGTAALTRMSGTDRKAVMKATDDWLTAHGIDYATFQSQYKAQNEVVQNNVARSNNTSIAAQDVSQTTDQFLKDFTPTDVNNGGFLGLGSNTLSAQNVLDLMAGKQVNNPLATKYGFDVNTMANDLATYYAASRTVSANGAPPSPDDVDKATAAKVIAEGINTGSAAAFKESIDANEKKVTGVVNAAVDSANRKVWDLFGVGSQYKTPAPQIDPKTAVETFTASPAAQTVITPEINTKVSTITGGKTFSTAGELAIYMSGLPGATPESVASTLKSLGYMQ